MDRRWMGWERKEGRKGGMGREMWGVRTEGRRAKGRKGMRKKWR
jgi:hypothetical protein